MFRYLLRNEPRLLNILCHEAKEFVESYLSTEHSFDLEQFYNDLSCAWARKVREKTSNVINHKRTEEKGVAWHMFLELAINEIQHHSRLFCSLNEAGDIVVNKLSDRSEIQDLIQKLHGNKIVACANGEKELTDLFIEEINQLEEILGS